MAQLCFKCNAVEVQEEFQRCPSCESSHQALAKQLDSRPRTKEKKVKEQLFPIKRMRGGIQCTDWIDREDAMAMGIALPK